MIQLKPITKQDGNKLKKYYQDCEYGLCEYSVGTKMMWRSTWKYQWAEVAGCLVVRGEDRGRWIFDYPVAGPEGDEDAALGEIEKLCLEQGQQLMLTVVPECKAARLLTRYPYLRVSDARTWRDYVYYRQDLQLFAGRRYSGQRNHIKKFRQQWPDAELRRLTMPVLVIAGEKDMIQEEHTRLIAASIPGARLSIIPGDHFIANRESAAFNAEVRSFFKEAST